MGWVFSLPIIRKIIQKKIDGNFEKLDQAIYQDIEKKRDQKRSHKLPASGMNEDNLKRRI